MNQKPTTEVFEKALLASILINPECLNDFIQFLQPDDFAGAFHRALYEEILGLDADGKAINELSTSARLEGRYSMSDIAELCSVVPAFHMAEEYARHVKDAAMLRRLKFHAAELIQECNRADADAYEVLAGAESRLSSLSARHVASQWTPAGKYAAENVSGIKESMAGGKAFLKAVPTGFDSIDRIIQGFRPGDLCYLAARPSQGKTAMAMGMAYNQAKHGHKVAFLSVEMQGDSLILRLQSTISGIPLQKIRACDIKREIMEFESSAKHVNRLQLWIDDSWSLKPMEMRSKLRKIIREQQIDIAYMDYIGLMQEEGEERRAYERVSAISKALKQMAREMKIPIVALAQLRRLPAGSNPQRPELSDLRDSGNLEQDADLVIFIHRIEQHLLDKTKDEDKGKAEIIVAKQRNGPVGIARMAFVSEFCRFADLESAPYRVEAERIGRDYAAGGE